jgi:hypothetical protein
MKNPLERDASSAGHARDKPKTGQTEPAIDNFDISNNIEIWKNQMP